MQEYLLPTGRLVVEEASGNTECLRNLCRIGARANPKRGFLFVSTVLGKHLPVRPSDMARWHRILADRIGRMNNALFVGMAETAVGLGYGVFEACFRRNPDAKLRFLHTTRYSVSGFDAIEFAEEHSHAPEQYLHLPEDADTFKTLVLIDDEVTTGRTFANLWETVRSHLSGIREIILVTLTDFLGDSRVTFTGARIRRISLARAVWRFEPSGLASSFSTPVSSGSGGISRVRAELGRIGIDRPIQVPSSVLQPVLEHARDAALVRVVGVGEFIHAPQALATTLEERGVPVVLQSLTRSPALLYGAIESMLRFEDPYGQGHPHYLYNLPERHLGEVRFLIHETEPNSIIRSIAGRIRAIPLQWQMS